VVTGNAAPTLRTGVTSSVLLNVGPATDRVVSFDRNVGSLLNGQVGLSSGESLLQRLFQRLVRIGLKARSVVGTVAVPYPMELEESSRYHQWNNGLGNKITLFRSILWFNPQPALWQQGLSTGEIEVRELSIG
jgi:hypothetical protein